MSRADHFAGALCIIAVVSWVIVSAEQCIIDNPSWVGLLFAACNCITGCFVIASVWRDRL